MQSRSIFYVMSTRGIYIALAFTVKIVSQHVGKCVQVQHILKGGEHKLAIIGI